MRNHRGRLLRRLWGPRVSSETAQLFAAPLRAAHSNPDLNKRRGHEFYRISRRNIVDAAMSEPKESDDDPSDEGIGLVGDDCRRRKERNNNKDDNKDNKGNINNNKNIKEDTNNCKEEEELVDFADGGQVMRTGPLLLATEAWVPAMLLPSSKGWSLQCRSCRRSLDRNNEVIPKGNDDKEEKEMKDNDKRQICRKFNYRPLEQIFEKEPKEADPPPDYDQDSATFGAKDAFEAKIGMKRDEVTNILPRVHCRPALPFWNLNKTSNKSVARRSSSLDAKFRKSSNSSHMCVTEANFPELVSALQKFLRPAELSESDSLEEEEESISLGLQRQAAERHCYGATRGQREREQEVCEVWPQQIEMRKSLVD